MARYISQWGAYKVKVIPSQYTLIQGPNGPREVLTRNPVIAIFSQQGTTDYEKEVAMDRFRFKGLAEGEDPLRRVSAYDTEQEARQNGWNEDFRKEVERILDAKQGVDFFRVDKPRAISPWPTYDKTPPKKILQMVEDMGIDPESVIAYEVENKNRPEIIEALQPAEEEEEIIVSA